MKRTKNFKYLIKILNMKNINLNFLLICCFTLFSFCLTAQPLTDGTLVFIKNCETGEYLTGGSDPTTSAGTPGALNTQWAIVPNTTGGFNIDSQIPTSPGSGVLRAEGNGNVIGTNFTPNSTGSNANDKKWTITYDPTAMTYIFKRVGNSRSLRANAAGTPVSTEDSDGSAPFKWKLESVTPLPLDFISLKAQNKKSGTQLTWEIANEVNNSHFEILKGNDLNDFQSIGSIENESGQELYQFLDRRATNQTSYYKIKQVDFDGKFSFSKIISVKSDAQPVVLYPNPVQQDQEFTIESKNGYQIFNSTGMLVRTGTENTIRMDLEKGIYFLIDNNSSNGKRFIVY